MRVKELSNKLAHVCWAPYNIYPSYIACGTSSAKMDNSFGTNSQLELLKLDLSNSNTELEVAGTIPTESRFSKLIWGNHSTAENNNLLIGGCEDSKIYLYDYEKILNSDSALVKVLENHTGMVSALDLNPFQSNLLASGASASEIFIWDLNNSNEPMTPGAKVQPADDVNCVAWNRQVQHILASTCNGKCVVWDLRKNESIIKVSDNMSKMKAQQVAWHPDIATQMCLSSDDDHSPFLQIWDLRFATSPVRILEGHQRGILNFAWCSADSNLLVSSSKDNRIICWNPNNATTNGEILYDLPTSGQWCFDVSWSQRNPDLICASSFEAQINVYSLMGGKYNVVHQTSSKIMDSFGVDSNSVQNAPPEVQQISTQIIPQIKIAPKWMKRTCGASFGFGGKLIQFGKYVSDNPQEDRVASQRVTISQVTTDPVLVERAQYLESVLKTGNLSEFCNYKIEIADNENESTIWKFIMVTLNHDKTAKYLELLGFNQTNLDEKLSALSVNGDQIGQSNDKHNSLEQEFKTQRENENVFDQICENNATESTGEPERKSPVDFSFTNDIDKSISESLIIGNYKAVVDLCIKENRFTDAILVASTFDQELFEKTKKLYFKQNQSKLSKLMEGVLSQDWPQLVLNCNLQHWREVLAAIMTYTSGEEASTLCDQLGSRLEQTSDLLNACICYIVSMNLDNLAGCWEKLTKEKNDHEEPSVKLQELIEKIMALRYSLQNTNSSSQQGVKMSSKLAEYAKLLTDQGQFLNAYNYINESNDSSILIMKNRIYQVLDPQVIQQNRLLKPENPFQTSNPNVLRKNSLRNSLSNSHTPVSRGNSYSNSYNSTTSGCKASYPSSPHITTPPNQLPSHVSPQPNSFVPPNHNNPIQGQNLPNVTNNLPPSVPVQPSKVNTGFFTPSIEQPAAPNTQPLMPSYMHQKAPTGWNDPPMIKPKIKPPPAAVSQNEMPTFFQPTMPATNLPPANTFNTQFGGYQQSMHQPNIPPAPMQDIQQNQMFQPSYDQNQMYQANLSKSSSYPSSSAQKMNSNSRPASTQQEKVPETVEKGPIPAEHQMIKTTFDTLLNKCITSTNAPVVKRKLDDVGKKLEVLYDKLRDSTLSESVVAGLNTIVQRAQISDYASTLSEHSQLVATSNFSEISGFMPGIKVLIQSCQQLGATFN